MHSQRRHDIELGRGKRFKSYQRDLPLSSGQDRAARGPPCLSGTPTSDAHARLRLVVEYLLGEG